MGVLRDYPAGWAWDNDQEREGCLQEAGLGHITEAEAGWIRKNTHMY